MMGCHDLDGMYNPELGREVFDFSVTVHRLIHNEETGTASAADTFKITKDGSQKFYNLTGILNKRSRPPWWQVL